MRGNQWRVIRATDDDRHGDEDGARGERAVPCEAVPPAERDGQSEQQRRRPSETATIALIAPVGSGGACLGC